MSRRTPSIAQRSSLGRTAARKLAAAAEAAPAPAPTAGVTVQAHGHGGLARRGAAKTPSQIVDAKLLWDCWKETARGVKSRAQFEAFCKGLGIRVQWLNLDGGGVNCILYLVMGKNKRIVPIQCQYLHAQAGTVAHSSKWLNRQPMATHPKQRSAFDIPANGSTKWLCSIRPG